MFFCYFGNPGTHFGGPGAHPGGPGPLLESRSAILKISGMVVIFRTLRREKLFPFWHKC